MSSTPATAHRSKPRGGAETVEAILDRIEQEAPQLARLVPVEVQNLQSSAGPNGNHPASTEDWSSYIEEKLRLFASAARRGRPPSAQELAFVRERSALRARELLPLEALLRLHDLGHRGLWQAIWEASAPTAAGMKAAASLVPAVFDFAIAMNEAAVDGYLTERSFGLVDAARARRDALEALLTRDGASYNEAADRAKSLGVRFGREHVIVTAVVSAVDGVAMPETLRQAAELLARRATARADQSFTVVRHHEIVAIVRLDGREPSAVSGAVATAAGEARDRYRVQLLAGVSAPFRAPDELGRAYAQSRRALVHAGSRGAAVALEEVGVFEELAASAGPAALTMIPEPMRACLLQDLRHGGALIRTLRAYADADLNIRDAAEMLSVHPNTVHYRLSQIAKRSGRDPRHLPQLIEIVTAMRLLGCDIEQGAQEPCR